MNRRSLLKALPAIAVIPILASARDLPVVDSANGLIMSFAPDSWRKRTAKRMIAESGEMWLAVRERYQGRNPILLGFDDGVGVEISRMNNGWCVVERKLSDSERDMLREYKSNLRRAFLQEPRIGAKYAFGDQRLRAFVINGRRPKDMGWTMSLETV